MFHSNKLLAICTGALIIGTLGVGTFAIYNNFFKSSHFSSEIISENDIYIEKKRKNIYRYLLIKVPMQIVILIKYFMIKNCTIKPFSPKIII